MENSNEQYKKKRRKELKLNVYVLSAILVTLETSQPDKSVFIVPFSQNKDLISITSDTSQFSIGQSLL